MEVVKGSWLPEDEGTRKAIEARFTEDLDTLLHFPDTNLRSNGTHMDNINEWKEQNLVVRILRVKKKKLAIRHGSRRSREA